jgi:DNA-binding NarL/FixJ family response regulator
MPAEQARKPRVLLGNLDPMIRLGMSRVLTDDGLEVIAGYGDSHDVVAHAINEHPDTVVLGMDDEDGRELGENVRAAAPKVKVILWARDETEMEVFDPGSSSPRRIRTSVSGALRSEVGAEKPQEEGR